MLTPQRGSERDSARYSCLDDCCLYGVSAAIKVVPSQAGHSPILAS